MMTGGYYRKIKAAIDGGLAIYSSHIPLDVHPQWGNNAILAEVLGLKVDGAFLDWKGVSLGVTGQYEGDFAKLLKSIETTVGPIFATNYRTGPVGRLGIITGGAGSEVQQVKDAGIHTFLTGEGPHWSFPLADELGLNVIHAGHYATETFGVKRLGAVLKREFEISESFLSHPTGL